MGKTFPIALCDVGPRKHPHGRGEDRVTVVDQQHAKETPPRAWGRPPRRISPARVCRKHPHGRGEDRQSLYVRRISIETPPRAWGRLTIAQWSKRSGRNTPTGVGKTEKLPVSSMLKQKHPHGRGEDPMVYVVNGCLLETPPRAWGRLRPQRQSLFGDGNTPTGVGKT